MARELVVIPVYNEEKYIGEILKELSRWYSNDVLCIDDGSCDSSPKILGKLSCPKLVILRHEKNKGYGATLIEGFNYAIQKGYDKVVTMDCDWQHEPHFVPTFFKALTDIDIVSGSRYLESHSSDSPAPVDRKAINGTITQIINAHTKFNVTDGFCGFKALKVEAIKKLALDEPGYAFPLQFWIQAAHFGLTVKELAVPRIYIDASRTFGGHLDNPDVRLAHYKCVIEKELKRWKIA